MHKTVGILLVWMTCILPSLGSEADLLSTSDNRDLGEVWSYPGKTGSRLNFDIELLNKAKYPIDIINIATSCSCTTTGSRSGSILPGKNISIPVSVDIKGREGLLRGAIVIQLGDHSVKQVFYQVTVNVPLRCVPQVVAITGEVGKSAGFQFVIYKAISGDQKKFQTLPLNVNSKIAGLVISFKTKLKEVATLPSVVNGFYYDKYTIEADLMGDRSGSYSGVINILDPALNGFSLDVPLRVDLTDDTYLVRDRILMGNVGIGENKACSIEVISSFQDEISKIIVNKRAVVFIVQRGGDSRSKITAQFETQWSVAAGLSVIHGEALMKSGKRLPFSLVAIAN